MVSSKQPREGIKNNSHCAQKLHLTMKKNRSVENDKECICYNYTIVFKNLSSKIICCYGCRYPLYRLAGPSRAIDIESDVKTGGRWFDSQSGHILLSLRSVHENIKRF